MSKASKEQAARNREAAVAAASALIRRKGVDGVGIRELMSAAGLTQGALSGQFGTKDALVAEACAHAFDHAARAMEAAAAGDPSGQAKRIAEYYLSAKPEGFECPMATLAVDASRTAADSLMRRAFSEGLDRLTGIVAGEPPSSDRLVLLAAMVGAAVLRDATDNGALALKIDEAVGTYCDRMKGNPTKT